MKPEKEKLDLLLQIVAQTFGTTPHTPTDFVALASAVQESTGRTIGLSTLKRLWGYIKDQTGTTYSTLSLLSRYTGYSDWDSFCRFASLITDEQESGFSDPVPQYLLTLGRSSVMQMCSRSEGAMRLHCDRNKRTQMHDDWPRRWLLLPRTTEDANISDELDMALN